MVTYIYNKNPEYIRISEKTSCIYQNEKLISELEYYTMRLQNPNIPIYDFNSSYKYKKDEKTI